MTKIVSAGLLVYRRRPEPGAPSAPDEEARRLEILLVHPGGPYFARKELGVWSIPKGQVDPGEDRLAAARRECREETGYEPDGPFVSLGGVKYKNHKVVYAWAVEGDFDPRDLVSTTFELIWPPRSGTVIEAPEVDRAAWFGLESARAAIVPAQRRFLDDLAAIVGLCAGDADGREAEGDGEAAPG
jgi:predicted NUDIX family NTP pyrophosphohydrolase